jgi:hypothetical protein
MAMPKAIYRNADEVEEVVRRFESCETRPDDFKHGSHLVVALRYLLDSTDADALERMRKGLYRFLWTHGINQSVYHETLTVFWLKRVRAFIKHTGTRRTLAKLANSLLEECADSRLVYTYYSKELIDSDSARHAWTEPDLKPLDF